MSTRSRSTFGRPRECATLVGAPASVAVFLREFLEARDAR
jgi:hypothetical protein